jgi:hypothetical protein
MRFSVATALGHRGQRAPTERGGYSQLSLTRASGLGAAVTASEFFHPAGGIDEFLLAREKRMAGGADADFNVSFGRASMINRAARANDIGLLVIGMNVRLHVKKRAKSIAANPEIRK